MILSKHTIQPAYINLPIEVRDSVAYNEFNFNAQIRPKKYYTELILITNSTNINDINVWLSWHINIVKFEHVILIENNNSSYLKQCTDKFNGIVDYYLIPGILSQSELYTKYVNNSNAQWVLPIDDDEYLYISDKFDNNINTYIKYLNQKVNSYKYSFNWHMMFSKYPTYDRNEPIIKHNTELFIAPIDPMVECINLCKTIVNTDIPHLYVSDNNNHINIEYNVKICPETNYIRMNKYDSTGTVHNPISIINNNLVLTYNEETNQYYGGLFNNYMLDINANAYLYHYKYRTKQEWETKCQKFKYVDLSTTHVNTNYKNDIFEKVFNFISNKTITDKKLYNMYEKLG